VGISTSHDVRLELKCWHSAAMEEQTVFSELRLIPQPDGTLKGSETYTYKSNECGLKGATSTTPVIATRTSPASSNVVLADPGLFA
jgi:hypothetical protein